MAKDATTTDPTADSVKQLNDLTAQVGDVSGGLDGLKSALSNQKVLEWITLALAVLSFGAVAILFLKRKR